VKHNFSTTQPDGKNPVKTWDIESTAATDLGRINLKIDQPAQSSSLPLPLTDDLAQTASPIPAHAPRLVHHAASIRQSTD
jgi:hypothetical protein